jgi:hypothetical protein
MQLVPLHRGRRRPGAVGGHDTNHVRRQAREAPRRPGGTPRGEEPQVHLGGALHVEFI